MIVEIVILAMIAAFLGLRLYSVLGRRAEHEEESIPTRFDNPPRQPGGDATAQPSPFPQPVRPREFSGLSPALERGLQDIHAADRSFAITPFVEGAKAAYAMILEAFWNGDRDELKALCSPEVYSSFRSAIDAREAAGESLDNRLIRIEEAVITSASLDGRMARIAVRLTSDIAAVTRDREGNVIAGSLDDAVESRDVWTFVRNVQSAEPDWTLEETDEG